MDAGSLKKLGALRSEGFEGNSLRIIKCVTNQPNVFTVSLQHKNSGQHVQKSMLKAAVHKNKHCLKSLHKFIVVYMKTELLKTSKQNEWEIVLSLGGKENCFKVLNLSKQIVQ